MNGVTSSTPSEGAVGDRHRIGVREMTNKSRLLLNILGGAIFVYGIVPIDAQIGHKKNHGKSDNVHRSDGGDGHSLAG